MKSVSYRTRWCVNCNRVTQARSNSTGIYHSHHSVIRWVLSKVELSRYIWEHTKGCQGCAKVMQETCEELGNLLQKLGINVR